MDGFGWTLPYTSEQLWGQLGALSNAYRVSFRPGVKQPGCEVDNSPTSIAEIKHTCSYASTLLISLHDVHRDKFSLITSV